MRLDVSLQYRLTLIYNNQSQIQDCINKKKLLKQLKFNDVCDFVSKVMKWIR